MYQFCFNDCIPSLDNRHQFIECLALSLREYNKIKREFPSEIDGVITGDQIGNFMLTIDFTLADCVLALTDRDLRNFAFRVFTKYPIEKYYFDIDEDDLITKDYEINIDGNSYSAINLAIACTNNGILFTLAIHEELKRNELKISSNTNDTISIINLFGYDENTKFIVNLVKDLLESKLNNFDRLLSIIGSHRMSSRFKKGFEYLSALVQDSIIEHFAKARNRKGKTPFHADGELIKDVTPESVQFRVY